MGGRPASAVAGSLGVVVMVSSVVSSAGAASYDALQHQNRLATRPELIAAGGARRRACVLFLLKARTMGALRQAQRTCDAALGDWAGPETFPRERPCVNS
jgi:hypothetical protein